MEEKCFFVYIMAARPRWKMYTGLTSDLPKRVWEHREGVVPGYTRTYGLKLLVWYEMHDTHESAGLRERAIKRWHRDWKFELIEQQNPYWRDLYESLF